VVLSAKSDDDKVQVSVLPEQVPSLKPGDKVDFKIKIKVVPGARAEKHKVSIGIAADKIGFESMDESPVEQLRKLVQTPGTNPSTQVLAAEALAKREDPIAFEFLKDMAKNHKIQDYRSRAIRALGRVGNESSLSFLEELLDERDGYLKGCTMMAIAMLTAQTTPKATLSEKDPVMKACSAAARTEKDPFVKACAQASLTFRGNRNYLMSLRRGLKDSDPYVKLAAAWGLAATTTTGKKDGVEALDEMLGTSGKDVKLRIFVGEALISLPERESKSRVN
jgi:HEAT repeat protein